MTLYEYLASVATLLSCRSDRRGNAQSQARTCNVIFCSDVFRVNFHPRFRSFNYTQNMNEKPKDFVLLMKS